MVNPSRNRQHRPQSWTRVATEAQTAIWQSITDLPLLRACCPSIWMDQHHTTGLETPIWDTDTPLGCHGHPYLCSFHPSLPRGLMVAFDATAQDFHTSALRPLCASVQPTDIFHIEHFHEAKHAIVTSKATPRPFGLDRPPRASSCDVVQSVTSMLDIPCT